MADVLSLTDVFGAYHDDRDRLKKAVLPCRTGEESEWQAGKPIPRGRRHWGT